MEGHKENGTFHPHDSKKGVHSSSVNSNTLVTNTSFEKHGKKLQASENKKSKITFKEFIDSGKYLEDEVRRRAEKGSPHFFDADTMRFFSSRISELMWADGNVRDYKTNDIYFITSEADKGSIKHSGSVRAFTVRKIDKDGDIEKIGEFQGFVTLNEARHEIMDLINGGKS